MERDFYCLKRDLGVWVRVCVGAIGDVVLTLHNALRDLLLVLCKWWKV